MLQTLEVTGYMFNKLRRLSQNSSRDVELPVRLKDRRCSHGSIVVVVVVTQRDFPINATFL